MNEIPETLELYNYGKLQTYTKQEDRNGEHLYVAEDGDFVKFPVNYAEGDSFEKAVQRYNDANSKEVELGPADVTGFTTTYNT